ncbi:MAG: cupin domain-containing protein [Planctomycetes bacterium]|nr:cupin domain-containing protein [Planctomycetota bacterium]
MKPAAKKKVASTRKTKGYLLARFEDIPPVACPCGQSRRAFKVPENRAATIHRVDISKDAQTHYHKRLTEIYYILEGEGALELNGDPVPVRPGTAILIQPGTRHRAVGHLKVLVIAIPTFDEGDEYLD